MEYNVYLFMAKTAYSIDRYQDSINYLKEVIDSKPILNGTILKLLNDSFHVYTHKKIKSILVLQEIIQKLNVNSETEKIDLCYQILNQLIQQKNKTCKEAIDLIETKILTIKQENEAIQFEFEILDAAFHLFYLYFNNLDLLQEEIKKTESMHIELIKKIDKKYHENIDYCSLLQKINFNYANFVFHILKQEKKAYDILKYCDDLEYSTCEYLDSQSDDISCEIHYIIKNREFDKIYISEIISKKINYLAYHL